MLFNYHTFLNELKEKEEKKEMYEKYTNFFPNSIDLPLNQQMWFSEYIKMFPIKNIDNVLIPDELQNDFDWELLQKLIAGSFSSDGCFKKSEKDNLWEFEINVATGNQFVTKRLSELWGFQILRLYEIYVEEQMNLQILIKEDEREKEAILTQRKTRLTKWSHMLNRDELLFQLDLLDIE